MNNSVISGNSIKLGDSWVDLSRSRLENSMLGWGNESVAFIDREVSFPPQDNLGNSALARSSDLSESGWQIVPDSLEGSWVSVQENTFIVARKVADFTEKKDVGIIVKFQMMATVMEAVAKGTMTAAYDWDKLTCVVAGIVGGGAQMVTLNPVGMGMGALRVAASLKIMWEMYDKLTPSNVQEIIDDSRSSVDAVRLLAQANKESLNRVEAHLVKAMSHAKDIQGDLDAIKQIHDAGMGYVSKLKKEARASYKAVREALVAAQANLQEADAASKEAEVGFAVVIELLNQMVVLFGLKEGTEQERVEGLANLTQEIADKAQHAYDHMQLAHTLRRQSDEQLDQVIFLEKQAAWAYGQALGAAKGALKQIGDQAGKAKEGLNVTAWELVHAEKTIIGLSGNNNDIMDIAGETMADFRSLQSISSHRADFIKMLSATSLALTLSGIGTIPAILLSTAVVYSAGALCNCIGNWLARKAVNVNTLVRVNDNISYEFDYRSTSLRKKFFGKVSQTVGSLKVKVGAQELNMRFDLNKEKRIRKSDLLTFSMAIQKAVAAQEITDKQALKLIDELKAAQIGRNVKDWLWRDRRIVDVGFIAENEPRLQAIERQLKKIDEPQLLTSAADADKDPYFNSFEKQAFFI